MGATCRRRQCHLSRCRWQGWSAASDTGRAHSEARQRRLGAHRDIKLGKDDQAGGSVPAAGGEHRGGQAGGRAHCARQLIQGDPAWPCTYPSCHAAGFPPRLSAAGRVGPGFAGCCTGWAAWAERKGVGAGLCCPRAPACVAARRGSTSRGTGRQPGVAPDKRPLVTAAGRRCGWLHSQPAQLQVYLGPGLDPMPRAGPVCSAHRQLQGPCWLLHA